MDHPSTVRSCDTRHSFLSFAEVNMVDPWITTIARWVARGTLAMVYLLLIADSMPELDGLVSSAYLLLLAIAIPNP